MKKVAKKVFFDSVLPFFWVRIACLNGMCERDMREFGNSFGQYDELKGIERKLWMRFMQLDWASDAI